MSENTHVQVTFWSGVGSVTGANFLIEFTPDAPGSKPTRALVDCGLIQGEKTAMLENRNDFGYDPKSIDMLFVTHAHLDHVGRIAKLVKEGFKGVIYSTPETKALGELIMEDAVGLLQRAAQQDGIEPIYNEQNMRDALLLWKTIPYHQEIPFDGFSVYLKDAGHILGSSMFQFSYISKGTPRKMVFTGDLGNSPTPLLRDTESIEGADYVIMESVYGDRNHEPKDERREKLQQIILDTIKRGGTLVIPAFSLERTQVIIYEINKLVENKMIPSIPVFIDSPLAIRITEIYKASKALFNDRARAEIDAGDDLFNFPRLSYTITVPESRQIDHARSPKIIIAGSGMSVGGRVLHHEDIYLPDPKSSLLLVGYQTLGSTGRHLLDGAKKVTIGGQEVEVRAKVDSILGYSSHKDSDHLVQFAAEAQATAKKIFVVMGEPKASTFLAQRINNEVGVKAICPERGVPYELN